MFKRDSCIKLVEFELVTKSSSTVKFELLKIVKYLYECKREPDPILSGPIRYIILIYIIEFKLSLSELVKKSDRLEFLIKPKCLFILKFEIGFESCHAHFIESSSSCPYSNYNPTQPLYTFCLVTYSILHGLSVLCKIKSTKF